VSDQPTTPTPRRSLRRVARLACLGWLGWGFAVISLWVQYQVGVYQTHGWLWLPFAIGGVLAGLVAFAFGFWRTVRGPSRRAALGWAVHGLLPLLLWGALIGYMFREQGRKNLPNTHSHKVGRMAAVTLMIGHAQLAYPRRIETDRLAMYHDDRLPEPAADVAALEVHLDRMEDILGRRQHSRIHWVRGPALGQSMMSIHPVALGSDSGKASELDRHEIAHAFLYQFSDPGSEPPMLLLEGWAMAVDGHKDPPLAMAALGCREPGGLGALLAADRYHRGNPDAYYIGGALVDFLLRRHGPEPFLAFYNTCHPETYAQDFERTYEIAFEVMEAAFWKEMERVAGR
jgi:hypothetical protein